jgi:hypothetical protein
MSLFVLIFDRQSGKSENILKKKESEDSHEWLNSSEPLNHLRQSFLN